MDELPFPKKPRITPKGRRQKGKRYEREIAALYRHWRIDDTAQPMPMSGAMEFHKGDLLKKKDTGFVDECKCQETIKLYKWWGQAKSQARGLQVPILHIKKNLSESLTVMSTEQYFQLRREILDLQEQIDTM